MVHRLEQEYAGRVKIARVDVDEPANRPILREHRVPGTPYLVFIDARSEVKLRRGGAHLGPVLRADIEALLRAP